MSEQQRATGAGGAGEQSQAGALGGAVRSTGLMTLASRLFGMLRDVLVGRVLGDTALGSAFAAAFAVPNMFRRLLGEGALSAAFVPAYARAHGQRASLAGALASLTLRRLGLVTGALTVVIELGLLAALLLAGGDQERAMSIKLLMVMLPFMPFVCCTAILMGMLQVHGRYALAASGPVVLNAVIIVTGLYFVLTGQRGGAGVAYALGVATVVAGAVQTVSFWRALRPHAHFGAHDEGAREAAAGMWRAFAPAAIGLGALQVGTLLDTVIAMWPVWVGPTVLGRAVPLDEASNAILSLTSRLYQFPLGVFGVAVATAAFPLLARTAGDDGAFAGVLRRGVRLSLLVGLPASAGLVLVRHDLVSVLFAGGPEARTGFSAQGVARSADVLLGYSVAVWAYGLNQVLTRAFYARGDVRTPMRVAIAGVGLSLALNLALIWPLREAGIAWGTAISAVAQLGLLAWIGRGRLPRVMDAQTARSALVLLALTGAMAGAVLAVLALWPEPGRWREHALRLCVCTVVGTGVYGGLCLLLRRPEVGWLVRRGG